MESGEMRALWREMEKVRTALEALAHPRELLSVGAAADSLSISPRAVRRLVASGELVTVRIGRRTLIPVTEVRRLATPTPAPQMKSALPKRTTKRQVASEAEKLRAGLANL